MLSFTSSYALSVTLSLFLSLRCLALAPASIVWYKNPGIHFHLIIDRNKLIRTTTLFHLKVAHNICLPSLSIHPSIFLSVHLSTNFYVCLSIYPSFCLTTHPPVEVAHNNWQNLLAKLSPKNANFTLPWPHWAKMTRIGSFLFASCHPRWWRQVRLVFYILVNFTNTV